MRQFFYSSFLLLLSVLSYSSTAQAQALLDPRTQPQFVNLLPIPTAIDATAGGRHTITISQFPQWLGLVDPATGEKLYTQVWGYNGTYPGPTIVAKSGVPLEVFWLNNLVDGSNRPLPHLLPVDTSLHWALEEYAAGWETRGVPIVTHLHGGLTESESDGLPDAWYTPGFALKGSGFHKGDVTPYYYPNAQEAATIWYHDHALGITRLNVYAGLAGYYILTDDNEQKLKDDLKLPAAPYDIGLAIQDRMFTTGGALYYPAIPEEEEAPAPSIQAEFFGDFILVNGATWPVLEVEPRQYRFRLLNGSDSRFYNLSLSSGQQFLQIGSDDGLLPEPLVFDQVLIGTGERKDVIIDFSDPSLWGQTIVLRNNARTPFPKGETIDPRTAGRIMAFKVTKPLSDLPLTRAEGTLRPPIAPLQTNLQARELLLFEGEDEHNRLKPMLGTVQDGPLGWTDPVTENPALHSTEVWEIYNATEDAHTIHLHMVHMQLLNRQKFHARLDEETGKLSNIRVVGQPREPGAEEKGWKDTYIMYPGEVTRVIARFGIEGASVWHCHILSHEDHEMMRPYFIGEMEEGEEHIVVHAAAKAFEETLRLQAVPNPFSSRLDLHFHLAKASRVVVNVYDVGGRRVQQVFDGQRPAGPQQVGIDASQWSNGSYFLEVVIDGQRVVRKLTGQK